MKDWGFDITELEGNHVVYSASDGRGGRDVQVGRVVGCELDVGVTIVALGDPEDYLVCLPMAGIPGYDELAPSSQVVALTSFELIVDGIIAGCVDTDPIEEMIEDYYIANDIDSSSYGYSIDGDSCAFGQ